MKRFWYNSRIKTISRLMTGLLAGLLVLCLAEIYTSMEGHISLREMSLSFENTDTFLQTVYNIVLEKIGYDQNIALFELNGDFNENKLIDVRQYVSGTLDETTANQNTTYHLKDLIELAQKDHGAQALKQRLEELTAAESSEAAVGERLSQESEQWESVLPVSGISLQETSRRLNNSDGILAQYYRDLCESSLDIYRRYQQYLDTENEQARSDAPSNVAYYVEDTATRQRYSNLSTASLAAAETKAEEAHLTVLFAGERRMNIMVTDTNYDYSDAVSQYFMQKRFGGSGERVFLAVDTRYAVGDPLHTAHVRYEQREPVIVGAIALAVLFLILIVALTAIAFIVTGRKEPGGPVRLMLMEEIPTEIAVGIYIVLIMAWGVLSMAVLRRVTFGNLIRGLILFVLVFVQVELCLEAMLGMERRRKTKTIWKNSVCYFVYTGTREVYRAKQHSQRLLFMYIAYIILTNLFLIIGGAPGLIMGLVLNLAVLLYLMRDVVGNKTIQEGLQQISEGKLDYRINVHALSGESREMGVAVNEMGEGLQKAVESMLQGERLKAELITNVSHDLKTPLTSIINYVDLMKRQNIEDPKTKEYLEILESKTLRLRQMTEDLIEVSKLSSGNVELHPAELSLSDFVWQAEGEFEDTLADAGLSLRISMPKERIMLFVDGAKLWRIFENLLGNAAKYAKENTTVELSVTLDENGQALIRFENEAKQKITVSAAHLKERFSRGDESRSTEGFGLGLSIAGNLTSAMGGTFDVEVNADRFAAVLTFPVI